MNNKKTVWIFNHYAGPPSMTNGTRHYNFAKYLNKDGYSTIIFAASTIHNSEKNLINGKNKYITQHVNGINFIFLKARNYIGNSKSRVLNMIDYYRGLFRVTKHFNKPDIILASSVHPLTLVAGIKIAKKLEIPCICEVRDMWPLTLVKLGKLSESSVITKCMYKLEHWSYKKADSIIFTMEGGKDYIKDMHWENKINIKKIKYINNGIDLNLFNYEKKHEILMDDDLNDDNVFKVIYTGSMGQANALEFLIKSAQIIQNKGIADIKFFLFGEGYKKKSLMDYCVENNIQNVVFKDKVEKKYIPKILSHSNLNIFTGQSTDLYKYGISLNKMFDYMASGKPTISNIQCGYDNLEKYKCGITVEAGNAEKLAEGILEFYNMSSNDYNSYCNNALKAAEKFDFKNLANNLEKIIETTITREGIKNES